MSTDSFDSAIHTCKVEVWQNDHCILEHPEVRRLWFGTKEVDTTAPTYYRGVVGSDSNFIGGLTADTPRVLNAFGLLGYDLRSQTVPFEVHIFAYDPISNQDYLTVLLGCWFTSAFIDDSSQFCFVSRKPWRPITIMADLPQKKQSRWWSGGNLPKLNGLQNRLEAIQQALKIATDHTYVESGLAVMPRLRALCDCVKEVVDIYDRGEMVVFGAAVQALRVAWERLDSDRPTTEEAQPCATT